MDAGLKPFAPVVEAVAPPDPAPTHDHVWLNRIGIDRLHLMARFGMAADRFGATWIIDDTQ